MALVLSRIHFILSWFLQDSFFPFLAEGQRVVSFLFFSFFLRLFVCLFLFPYASYNHVWRFEIRWLGGKNKKATMQCPLKSRPQALEVEMILLLEFAFTRDLSCSCATTWLSANCSAKEQFKQRNIAFCSWPLSYSPHPNARMSQAFLFILTYLSFQFCSEGSRRKIMEIIEAWRHIELLSYSPVWPVSHFLSPRLFHKFLESAYFVLSVGMRMESCWFLTASSSIGQLEWSVTNKLRWRI